MATNIFSLMLRLFPDTTRKVTISLMIIAMVSKPNAFPEMNNKTRRHYSKGFTVHHHKWDVPVTAEAEPPGYASCLAKD